MSVHVVALLFYLAGLTALLAAAGVALLAAGTARVPSQLPAQAENYILGGGFVVAGFLAFLGFVYFLFGRKLQRGRQWARVIVLILSTLAVVGAGLQIAMTGDPTAGSGAVVPLLFLLLLNTSAARAWFRQRGY